MKKICSGCSEERDVEQDFNWKVKNRGLRHTRCKYCQSLASKQHYKTHKQTYLERVRTREVRVIEDNQKRLAGYLSQHPCIDCGQSDIRVLEFDHVRGNKSNNIAWMVGKGSSWSTIETEIEKCEVRCANCHRIKECGKSRSWRHFLGL